MPKRFYDREHRVFTVIDNPMEMSDGILTKFRVKFVKNANFTYERLCFPESQPVTLYATKRCLKEVGTIIVDQCRMSVNHRSAEILAVFLKL